MGKIFIILGLFTFFSCQKETITPEHPITPKSDKETSNESKPLANNTGANNAYAHSNSSLNQENSSNPGLLTMSGSYKLTNYEINNPSPGKTKVIGAIVNEIVGFIISMDGDFDVDIDPIGVDLSEYDLSVIKIAKIKKLKISISNPEEDTKSRLDFIKEFKLDIVSMQRPEKFQNLIHITNESIKSDGCGVQCIELSLEDVNLMELITDTKEILLKPKLSIKKAPKKDFSVDVKIDYFLATEKPF